MKAIFTNNIQLRTLGLVVLCAMVLGAALMIFPGKTFASSASLTIPVEQVFGVTPGVQQDGTFVYEMHPLDPSYPLPAGAVGNVYTFTMNNSEVRNIGPIVFTHAGIFSYEIRNFAQPTAGFTLDSTIYTVVVAVRNVNGGLVAEIRTIYARSANAPATAKLETDRVVFEKSYGVLASNPGDKFDPPVVKTVQGNPARPYTFTFRLEAQGADHPLPAGATGNTFDITVTGSGRANFGTWAYTEAGTFIYTIREIPSDNSDYVFDTSIYTITDTVTQENGRLVVDRVVTNEDNRQVVSMSFLNTYVGTDVEVQDPPGAGAGAGVGTGTGQNNRPIVGPKTGDYADPFEMMMAMWVSALVALFTLILIYMDRRSEKEHGPVASGSL